MKAMLLKAFSQPLELGEIPIPSAGVNQVLVRVKAVGVCASDLKIVSGNHLSSKDVKLPHILGHEVAGEVAAVGGGVSNLAPGDRVAVSMYASCGECEYCLDGRDTLCTNLVAWTGFNRPGGMAEYVVIRSQNLVPLPPEVSFEQAAILGDAVATSLHAVRDRAQVREGQSVLILGPGGVGIHAVQIAAKLGARVIAVDVSEQKLAMAREHGAAVTLLTGEDLPGQVRELTNGLGAHVALDFTGVPEVQRQAAACLRAGGRLCLVGYRNEGDFAMPSMDLVLREIEVVGARACTAKELAETVDWVRRGWLNPVIDRTLPLEQANEALDDLRRNRTLGRLVLTIN